MQLVPLYSLKPHEKKEFTLDLLKGSNVDDHPKKQRGQIVVELTFIPFKEESMSFKGSFNEFKRFDSGIDQLPYEDGAFEGAGLLSVMVIGAENVDAEKHNNPCALVIFRGDKRKTKVMQRSICFNKWEYVFIFLFFSPWTREKGEGKNVLNCIISISYDT